MSQAASVGSEGAAAAAETGCAVLHMLAHCTTLVDPQTAKGAVEQASAVLRVAVVSLAPLGLASALCVLALSLASTVCG